MATLQFTEGQEGLPSAIHNGDQLLPNVVDGMAVARPSAVYAIIPKSFTSYDAGYRKVTYPQLANAVNGVAWLLTEQLGRGKDAKQLAYIGPNDISYVAVILGASKAGYSILSPPAWQTPANYAAIFEATKCDTLLTLAPPYAPGAQKILEGTRPEPRVVHIPSIFDLLDGTYRHYPYPHTYESIKDQPLVTVCSSGTTGTPKPLIYTHRTASSFIRQLQATPPAGYYNGISAIEACRVYVLFPFFHAGGMMLPLIDSVVRQTTLVTPLAGKAISPETIIEGLKLVDVDVMCAPSPYLEMIAKNKGYFDILTQRVKAIAFSGADLSDATGEALIAAGVHLTNMFSSSETMTIQCTRALQPEPADAWHYIRPHPYANAFFEPKGNDFFELVWRRNAEPEHHQPVFTLFPDLAEYRSKDLFSPHPSDPTLWRNRGRADDMIAAASCILYNPIPFEQRISRLPDVAAALMVGTGRMQNALLVEPTRPEAEGGPPGGELVARIWPEIEAANESLFQDARIARTHILVTSPDLPMARTAKGNVQRAPTVKLYGARLDQLYRENEGGIDGRKEIIPVHLAMGEDRVNGVNGVA